MTVKRAGTRPRSPNPRLCRPPLEAHPRAALFAPGFICLGARNYTAKCFLEPEPTWRLGEWRSRCRSASRIVIRARRARVVLARRLCARSLKRANASSETRCLLRECAAIARFHELAIWRGIIAPFSARALSTPTVYTHHARLRAVRGLFIYLFLLIVSAQ